MLKYFEVVEVVGSNPAAPIDLLYNTYSLIRKVMLQQQLNEDWYCW